MSMAHGYYASPLSHQMPDYGTHQPHGHGTGHMGGGHSGSHIQRQVLLKGQKRRLNIVACLVNLFVPVALFAVVSAVMIFRFDWMQPLIPIVLLVGIAFLIFCAYLAFTHQVQKRTHGDAEPNWYMFFFIACLLSYLAAITWGSYVWNEVEGPFVALMRLGKYSEVDPHRLRGEQLMDAGTITFVQGTKLNIKMSHAFKHFDIFCVAPITTPGNHNNSWYDFWAVGKNCCSGSQADFHCAGASEVNANSGIRALNDEDQAYYRMAVQQAEATYNIKAIHPLFFTFVEDAPAREEDSRHRGKELFGIGILVDFIITFFLVLMASIAFAKLGRY